MRRTERLFQIIQILRSKRGPVTGRALAEELEISLRTLYRDMAELIAQRLPIRGEAGTGYVLEAGYDMPPLMLTHDELEAAVLGASWVANRGDPALARGARDLIAKLTDSIPPDLRPVLLDTGLKPISFKPAASEIFDMAQLRIAVREGLMVLISYQNADGENTSRKIWPIVIGYMEDKRIIVAWCELRQGFRHFRTDRVVEFQLLEARYPEPIADLRRRWKVSLKADSEKYKARAQGPGFKESI